MKEIKLTWTEYNYLELLVTQFQAVGKGMDEGVIVPFADTEAKLKWDLDNILIKLPDNPGNEEETPR